MSSTDPETQGMDTARRDRFEAEIHKLRIKGSNQGNEHRLIVLGIVAQVVGVVITVVAFVASLGQADTRDVISLSILAAIGLTLAVVGAALFLRYSFARFLRYWLLRLIYETQDPVEADTQARP